MPIVANAVESVLAEQGALIVKALEMAIVGAASAANENSHIDDGP